MCASAVGVQAMTAIQQELVRELAGPTCFCKRVKTPGETFCKWHYFSLPADMKRALYKRLGAGYEEAYAAAKEFLELQANLKKQFRKAKAAAAPLFE